jgi:hypothetical protein
MDRQIVYVGQVPQDTDLLLTNKNTMIALGMLAQAVLGTSTLVDGLACTATSPASLQVDIGPGSIYSYQNVDGTAYGSINADTSDQIVKQGINLSPVALSCPAPATSGYSVNYLIQAEFESVDGGSTVLPYYNSSNPSVAYNGPNNTGVSQNTIRQGQCVLNVKAGTAATTGTQVTPTPDAGYTGLWVVTVANGQTTITSGNIAASAGAPFISNKLASLAPLASPAMTGVPTAPTASPGTNTTQLATMAALQAAISGTAQPTTGSASGLAAAWASNTTLTLLANEITLENGSGGTYKAVSPSRTINTGTTGADGCDVALSGFSASSWAYYYLISDGTNVRGLLSASATSPTMPGSYTYKALCGACRLDGSKNIVGFKQIGRKWQYQVGSNLSALPQMFAGNSGSVSTPTYTSLAISSYVPTAIASTIKFCFVSASNNGQTIIAPNSNYGAANTATNPPPFDVGPGSGTNITMMGELLLESSNIYYANSNGSGSATYALGFELNL